MPELPVPERWVPEYGNDHDAMIWAGAEADYDDWRKVGPVELPPLIQADPFIANVFTKRARRILDAALEKVPMW